MHNAFFWIRVLPVGSFSICIRRRQRKTPAPLNSSAERKKSWKHKNGQCTGEFSRFQNTRHFSIFCRPVFQDETAGRKRPLTLLSSAGGRVCFQRPIFFLFFDDSNRCKEAKRIRLVLEKSINSQRFRQSAGWKGWKWGAKLSFLTEHTNHHVRIIA